MPSQDYIAFESVNFANYFIRHQGYRLKISPEDNTALMHKDASFIFFGGKTMNGDGKVFLWPSGL